MTPAPATHRLTPNVGQRLFLGLLPALLAVTLVVGLAYYGEYGRSVPTYIVVGAAILALGSLVATWSNARYLAGRIARLADRPADALAVPAQRGADDLDRIEHAVERLQGEAAVLSARVSATLTQLDEVRLPLHILLEAKFGELNENQEELLGAARDAADSMDAALRRLGQLAELNRESPALHLESIQVNDVMRAVLAQGRAAAERREARVDVALEPGLPRIRGDRVRLAEALVLLLESAAASLDSAHVLRVQSTREGGRVRVSISPGVRAHDAEGGDSWLLARRLIEAQGGVVEGDEAGVTVVLGSGPGVGG